MARTQPDAVEQTDNVVSSDTGPDGDIKQPDEQQWGTRKKYLVQNFGRNLYKED